MEWVQPNGLGGYAAGTSTGVRTRRAHGLLTVAGRPPLDRTLLLAELDAWLTIGDGEPVPVCNHHFFPDALAPAGPEGAVAFSNDPVPTWRWDVDGAALVRQVFSVHGSSATVVAFTWEGAAPATLTLRPLLPFRRPCGRTWFNEDADPSPIDQDGAVGFELYEGAPTLWLGSGGAGAFEEDPQWWSGFRYVEDERRGMGDGEDLLSPGRIVATLAPGGSFALAAATTPTHPGDWQAILAAQVARRRSVRLPVDAGDERVVTLASSVSDVLAPRGRGRTVLSGFPGATDSSRDALVALPGLFLATERYAEAREVLDVIAGLSSKGLLPTRFSEDTGAAEYGGVDASLWFFHAVYKYLQYTQDFAFVRKSVFWTMVEIIGHLQRGTAPGVRTDRATELLVTGEDGEARTWMDAVGPDGLPATLRAGKCVELNALWYSAVCCLEWIAQKIGRIDLMRTYRGLSGRLREAFNREFWNPRTSGLFDVVGEAGPDTAIRPNQIVAVAVPFPLLTGDRQESVLALVERELLTPWGLRTLSPKDAAYVGTEPTDAAAAAAAVHQGAVHPWLMGSFVSAAALVRGADKGFKATAEGWLSPLLDHAQGPGCGHLPERFDGDEPHRPGGLPASTTGLAEVLRAWIEVVVEYPAFNIRTGG